MTSQILRGTSMQALYKSQHPLQMWSSKAGEMDSESLDTPAYSLSVRLLCLNCTLPASSPVC